MASRLVPEFYQVESFEYDLFHHVIGKVLFLRIKQIYYWRSLWNNEKHYNYLQKNTDINYLQKL